MRVKRLLYALGFFLIVQTVSVGFPSLCRALTWGYPPGSEYNCMVQEFHWTIYPDEDSARAARHPGSFGGTRQRDSMPSGAWKG